jgi:hypothetical protein
MLPGDDAGGISAATKVNHEGEAGLADHFGDLFQVLQRGGQRLLN